MPCNSQPYDSEAGPKRDGDLEATIGPMKTAGRVDRNCLPGHAGNPIDALIRAAGHHLRPVLNHPRALLVRILAGLFGRRNRNVRPRHPFYA